jgi:hypothetical protein
VLSVADYFAVPGAHAVTTREQLLCLREVELSYECRGRAIRVQGRCPRRDQRGGIFELHLLASLRHLVRLRTWRLRLLQRSTSLVLVLVKQEFYFLLKCETFHCCQLCIFHPDVRASKFLPKRSQDDIIAFQNSEGIARTRGEG